jgi:hypothetical protein
MQTKDNTTVRRIQVRLKPGKNPGDPVGPLCNAVSFDHFERTFLMSARCNHVDVWDNGCGMTHHELQQWATMGISQVRMHAAAAVAFFDEVARASSQSDRGPNVEASQVRRIDPVTIAANGTVNVSARLCCCWHVVARVFA